MGAAGRNLSTIGEIVSTVLRTLHVARIPILLFLLWAIAWPAQARVRAFAEISVEEYWGPWAVTTLLGFAFVVVALIGRARQHSWVVLGIEALVAGVVALVPPISWIMWLGVGGSWVTAMTSGFAQPLAIAWLSIVAVRAFHQARPDPKQRFVEDGNRDMASSPRGTA